ncbi:MAG: hypothetical protein AAF558_15635, partial [Verrucomicrobiota bacterium]
EHGYRCKMSGKDAAIVRKFLPPIPILSPEHCDITINLNFIELDQRDSWQRLRKSIETSEDLGTSSSLTGAEGETHGMNVVYVRMVSEDGKTKKPVNITKQKVFDVWEPGFFEARFSLVIYMQKIPSEIGRKMPTIEMQRRTELFARELIGGYRNLVLRIQYFLDLTHTFPGVACKKASESGFHATHEDACRLICHFKYFDSFFSDSILAEPFDSLRQFGVSSFQQLRRDLFKGAQHSIIDEMSMRFAKDRRVSPAIVKRKLLEYSIYHSMGQHFQQCGMDFQPDTA